MSRIATRLGALAREGRRAFVTYIMGGDPDLDTFAGDPARALPGAGADVIELGVPFTDPMADGPGDPARGPEGARGAA